MKNKSIKEVVFSKEDLHNKKLLTSFLIGNNVEFIPDQHNHGKWKALIRINGLEKSSFINKQIERTFMSESINKSPKSVKPFSPRSVSPKPRPSIQNVQYFSSNKDQPHSDFKEKSGITLFLDQTIKRMNQQAEVMSTYSQEIETLNHRLQNIKIVNQIQKYLFYKDMAKHSINKIGYDGILQKGCNCKAYNVTISFFLVGLYYHYLQREQEYLQDFHEMMMSLNQQERNCIRIESLRSIQDLFETIFLSQNFQHQQGIQRYVNDINNQIKKKQNLNLLRVCALMFNQQLESKLELLSKSLKKQTKNENNEIRPQNGLNQPQTPQEQQNPRQSFTPNKQQQTPPQSYTPQKQKIPLQQIIKNDSGLKIENLKKQKIDNVSTYTSIQKSQKHTTPTKSIHKATLTTPNEQQLTPQTQQNNIKYLQRQKIKNNKKQSSIQDSNYQTFRPTTPKIDENSVNVNKTSEFDTSLSINRQKKKKTLTQTLEKKFLQLIEEELQNAHSQWFKKIQVSDRYILSPQSVERHYEQALDRFMPDRVQYMSSDELVHYYDFVVKKSKHIYLQQLKQKGLREKSFSPQNKQK